MAESLGECCPIFGIDLFGVCVLGFGRWVLGVGFWVLGFRFEVFGFGYSLDHPPNSTQHQQKLVLGVVLGTPPEPLLDLSSWHPLGPEGKKA